MICMLFRLDLPLVNCSYLFGCSGTVDWSCVLIIVLCMPPHSSYLLQPLDVGCFLPLKRAYSDEINSLAQYSTKKIKKEAFLLAFKVAFKKLIIKENICAGFRSARLVLHNLEAVILKLDVVLYMLTPLKLKDTL
jgi:hypothetical protein